MRTATEGIEKILPLDGEHDVFAEIDDEEAVLRSKVSEATEWMKSASDQAILEAISSRYEIMSHSINVFAAELDEEQRSSWLRTIRNQDRAPLLGDFLAQVELRRHFEDYEIYSKLGWERLFQDSYSSGNLMLPLSLVTTYQDPKLAELMYAYLKPTYRRADDARGMLVESVYQLNTARFFETWPIEPGAPRFTVDQTIDRHARAKRGLEIRRQLGGGMLGLLKAGLALPRLKSRGFPDERQHMYLEPLEEIMKQPPVYLQVLREAIG